MGGDRSEIELIDLDPDEDQQSKAVTVASKRGDRMALAVLAVLLVGVIAFLVVPAGDPTPDPDGVGQPSDEGPIGLSPTTASSSERLDAVQVAQAVPPSLLAAELFAAAPTASGLRDLFDAVGGFEELQIATAEGAFDLVRFDPNDPNRLLASHRLSYGPAENQMSNEIWQVTEAGEVDQALWEPSISHDFVHYNVDGTATMWVHSGERGFAPRVAMLLGDGFTPSTTTEPMYASRFTSASGTVFALTGNGDYYSNESFYVDLVADDGTGVQTLDDGAPYGWIDNPIPELLLAYPSDRNGVTSVWNAVTLEPLPTHPLAGQPYQRLAISADQTTALGATFRGELQVIDLATGLLQRTFGSVNVTGVDQPITLSDDGTVAIIVESSGRVSMWWTGEGMSVVSIAAHAGQPRWVSLKYAPRSTSVVAADASRVALLTAARAQTPTTWSFIDTDTDSWITRACEQAGRPLSDREVAALGLPDRPRACPR